MGIPIKGKRLNYEAVDWYRFEEKGDWMIGVYTRSEESELWNCKVHFFTLIDSNKSKEMGKKVRILGGKLLDNVLEEIGEGTIIGIEFNGVKRSPKTRRRYKDFSIYEISIDDIAKFYGEENIKKIFDQEE